MLCENRGGIFDQMGHFSTVRYKLAVGIAQEPNSAPSSAEVGRNSAALRRFSNSLSGI